MSTPIWTPPQEPGLPPAEQQKKPWPARHKVASGFIALGVLLVALVAIGMAAAPAPAPVTAASSAAPAAPATEPSTAPAPSPSPVPPPPPTYTVAQEQAIASAESYLSDGSGFSKLGLIDQLHSHFGEGFSKALAVFAVNHVQVNWRHQAVLSARGYMSSEPGWSFSGLVDQLSSRYGEQFTLAQAEYAAHKVGL